MLDESFYQKADEIIANHTKEERSLIPIIQDIQAEYRYLPPELLTYVAKENRHHRRPRLQCCELL